MTVTAIMLHTVNTSIHLSHIIALSHTTIHSNSPLYGSRVKVQCRTEYGAYAYNSATETAAGTT